MKCAHIPFAPLFAASLGQHRLQVLWVLDSVVDNSWNSGPQKSVNLLPRTHFINRYFGNQASSRVTSSAVKIPRSIWALCSSASFAVGSLVDMYEDMGSEVTSSSKGVNT